EPVRRAPITLHRFLYANANPVMNVDPSGNISLVEVVVTFAVLAVVSLVPAEVSAATLKSEPPSQVKQDFYRDYGQALNACIRVVFRADAAQVGLQTIQNAPILDARLNSRQVGAISAVTTAVGSSNPFKGPYGTVYIASEYYFSASRNTRNVIYGTFA